MRILNYKESANNKKYILYIKSLDSSMRVEFDTSEEAIKAYNTCSEKDKFLYQPNKTYFLGTLKSTGKIVGPDHGYHRTIASCTGLFIAKNKNQIKTFLENIKGYTWYNQSSEARATKARLYGNGPYGFLYSSKIEDKKYGWNLFDKSIIRKYFSYNNIINDECLKYAYGAIDILNSDKISYRDNPYSFS